MLLVCLEKLLSLVKPGGHLILAGILVAEYAELSKSFVAAGCTELYSEKEGEWQGGLFKVPDKN